MRILCEIGANCGRFHIICNMKRHLGKSLAVAVGVAICAMSVCADTVFVEAESFKDWGGWVNDAQFMDQT